MKENWLFWVSFFPQTPWWQGQRTQTQEVHLIWQNTGLLHDKENTSAANLKRLKVCEYFIGPPSILWQKRFSSLLFFWECVTSFSIYYYGTVTPSTWQLALRLTEHLFMQLQQTESKRFDVVSVNAGTAPGFLKPITEVTFAAPSDHNRAPTTSNPSVGL